MYEKRISVALPALIYLIFDDSGSMEERLPGTSTSKFEWTSRYFGHILKLLLGRSTENRGGTVIIKPRYHIEIIIYGSRPTVWQNAMLNIEKAVEHYTASGNSLGLGGKLSGTDTRAAFELALDHLRRAVQDERFVNAFPPFVLHLSDGESSTDASPVAEQIKALRTNDGNVIVANAYIGTQTNLEYNGPEDFIGYTDEAEVGASEDNVRLFKMSSVAPETIHANLVADGIFPKLRRGSRLFFDIRTREMLQNCIQCVGSQGSRADR